MFSANDFFRGASLLRLSSFVLATVLVLSGCGGSGSGSSESSSPLDNEISIHGSDGPLAGADIAVFDLQSYLRDPSTAPLLIGLTDPVTALADELLLPGEAGVGPFLISVTANATTTDLSTGQAPIVSSVQTIVAELPADQRRIYATPLTTLAVALASAGHTGGSADAQAVLNGLDASQDMVKALFGFGMDASVDLFDTPTILDETTSDPTSQMQVAQYRAAIEAFATVIQLLAEDQVAAPVTADYDSVVSAILTSLINTNGLSQAVIDKIQSPALNDAVEARLSNLTLPASIAALLTKDDAGLLEQASYELSTELSSITPMPVIDEDLDGTLSHQDNCPSTANGDQADIDGDNIGDRCDDDNDNDGFADDVDRFPNDATEWYDTDDDGVGNNVDLDDDGDGRNDLDDNCPLDSNADQSNIDNDNQGDACDATPNGDTDDDGVDELADNCPAVANPDQLDSDDNGVGDACDDGAVVWPAVSSEITTDVDTDVAVIVNSMTLDEKIGQMVMAEIREISVSDVRDFHLGAVLNGGGAWPNNNRNSPIAAWVSLADNYYLASTDTTGGRTAVPVLWGTDAVHGHNNVRGATIFPHNIGLGAANNPGLIKQIGEATALEVAVTGIDWVFAPTLAVVRNDRWGRTYEGYSEDPQIVREYAGEMVRGLQGDANSSELFDAAHVMATAKHFVGDGGTENGDDQGNTILSEEGLRDIHAQGYFSALEAGAQTVMVSYSSWNNEKLHGSRYLLTDVLKGQMGFDGFLLGDWNGHGQVTGCSDDSCAAAFNAGIDMMMVPYDWQAFIANTKAQVLAGEIPMSRVDDAVTRILRVKMRNGLFDKSKPSDRQYANNNALMSSAAHKALARQAVRESLVLLKNSDSLLPLDPSSNVMVAGSAANAIAQACGGWSITWQGTGTSNADFPAATSILSGIQSAVIGAGGTVNYSTGGTFNAAAPPDVAIVVFGETPYAEYAGDLNNLEYQAGIKSDLLMLQRLRSQGIPVVSVFLSGRPLWVNKELNASNAFIAAWLPGTEGAGIADVVFANPDGSVNHDFSGKLSFSWPKQVLQHELNRFDEDYDPLFAYGFGLDYNTVDTLGDDLDETGTGIVIETVVLPGQVEAELYSSSFGIQTEPSTDIGGGSNVGFTNPGDWMEYPVEVASDGDYLIEYRVASQTGSSGFRTLLGGVQIDSVTVANTGGWQNWQTNQAIVPLSAGTYTLRIQSIGSNWNLNWIRFTNTTP